MHSTKSQRYCKLFVQHSIKTENIWKTRTKVARHTGKKVFKVEEVTSTWLVLHIKLDVKIICIVYAYDEIINQLYIIFNIETHVAFKTCLYKSLVGIKNSKH